MKIIHINFKLIVQKYERGYMDSHKKTYSLGLIFDGTLLVENDVKKLA